MSKGLFWLCEENNCNGCMKPKEFQWNTFGIITRSPKLVWKFTQFPTFHVSPVEQHLTKSETSQSLLNVHRTAVWHTRKIRTQWKVQHTVTGSQNWPRWRTENDSRALKPSTKNIQSYLQLNSKIQYERNSKLPIRY